ncbi:hypothetical protein DXA11_15630 [Bacteroides sp. AM56-10ce]|uniref:Uncharacterized protein n=1 Tax=Bacteroides xylanisolvens TaxID=371601 RepID=A0A3E4NKL1_9BACE|nr:hypothetical protein F3F42_19950 [Bacteroides ovatus]KAB6147718.1 hypothetical protein GA398_10315 [Bacteroides xylanisolvens]RGE80241.1 hypothetical protein DXA11_15630 [Bacteroides sp. AM56-10ce]KAA3916964.1 hypothetical protein F3D73_12075 [Bacteroides ovatus]MCU4240628.1 hypothetical protein [Bacteroides xylanisolvens]
MLTSKFCKRSPAPLPLLRSRGKKCNRILFHFSVLTTPKEQAQRFLRYLRSNGWLLLKLSV